MNASKKIATCYCSDPRAGHGQIGRRVEIRLDETTGIHTATKLHNGAAEGSATFRSQLAAIGHAAALGFDDVLIDEAE